VAGGWYFYTYQTSATAAFPDYPKLGLWPDGIYMTDNVFTSSSGTFSNVRIFVLNRSDLESGAALRSVTFDVPSSSEFTLLPSTMRGTPPPAGRENMLVELLNNAAGTLGVRTVHVDWTTPANSTLSGLNTINATPWTELTGSPTARDVVPQLGTTQKLDSSGGRAMVQNQYRNIGGVESLWIPHTVAVGSNQAAVRWYQLNVTGGTIATTPVQQSTYSPDTSYRYIPSLAVNKNGDMAIGYSVSSATMYPAIRYAGRLAGDPLNILTQDETTLVAGTGSQAGFNRWGDYSAMTVDPTDDCTFWYTTEYNEITASSWQTRVGKFRLPSCGQTALVTLNVGGPNPSVVGQTLYFTATVTPTPASIAPSGLISITNGSNLIASGNLDPSGQFTFNTNSLPMGIYNLEAVYGGDANYGSGFSSVYVQVINSNSTPVVGQGGLTCDEAGLIAALSQAGYITFNCPNPTTINVTTPFLSNRTISNTTTLDGSVNNQNITIDGGASTIPFQVNTGVNFTVKGLTIANGKSTGSGGGILSQGSLTVISTTLRSNTTAASGGGGAIYSSGPLTVTNTILKNNNGGNVGGAVYAIGSTTNVSNSTFDTNTALQGGGLFTNSPTTTINSNTFVSNSATGTSAGTQGLGGGLLTLGTTNLANNTFTANTSGFRGGAIWLNAGTLNINNDTIVSNSTSGASNGGGGIRISGGTVNVANTIFANNTIGAGNVGGPNILGTIVSQDYNLIKDTTSATIGGTTTNNITGVDPNLGALANNGGLTQTTLPQAGSPVLDKIPAANCAVTNGVDQRGYVRPALNAPGGLLCDIGAVEDQYNQPNNLIAAAGNNQAVTINQVFGQIVANITDGVGNGVAGLTITFTAPTTPGAPSGTFPGGASVATAVTDNNGNAYAPTFTANGNTGLFTLSVTTDFSSVGPRSAVQPKVTSNPLNLTLQNLAPNATAGQTYAYFLPFVANAANGFSSQVTIQNVGNAPASLIAQYYTPDGGNVTMQSINCMVIAANSSCIANNPFTAGAKGTGVLVSTQPLSVLVQEITPYGSSAYVVSAGTSSELIAPLAINDSLSFNTALTVANVGAAAAKISVTFYDQNGNLLPAATQNLTLAAHSSQTFEQNAANSQLPQGFYGWAQISGVNVAQTSETDRAQLVAQVLETRADIKFAALANAQVANQAQLYAPAIFNRTFGAFVTGANIVNPNNNPVQVSITYYDNTGKAYATSPFMLGVHAVSAIYQGASFTQGLPNGGLPQGFYGSASVTSSGGNIVMVVNEAGTQTKNGAAQSGTYAAVVAGNSGSKMGLPIVANAGQGYTTGLTILNTGDLAESGSISYYNPDGSAVAGVAPQSFTVAAHASVPMYQGAAGLLPAGFYGQAVITSSDNSLLVTTNAQSDNLFFTYTMPN
jgi:hypothetical protein